MQLPLRTNQTKISTLFIFEYLFNNQKQTLCCGLAWRRSASISIRNGVECHSRRTQRWRGLLIYFLFLFVYCVRVFCFWFVLICLFCKRRTGVVWVYFKWFPSKKRNTHKTTKYKWYINVISSCACTYTHPPNRNRRAAAQIDAFALDPATHDVRLALTVRATAHGRDALGVEHVELVVESGHVLDAHALQAAGHAASEAQVSIFLFHLSLLLF